MGMMGSGPPPPPPPLKNHKNIGLLSKAGLDPLKNHKATKLAFDVGPYWPTSETPFKWRISIPCRICLFCTLSVTREQFKWRKLNVVQILLNDAGYTAMSGTNES